LKNKKVVHLITYFNPTLKKCKEWGGKKNFNDEIRPFDLENKSKNWNLEEQEGGSFNYLLQSTTWAIKRIQQVTIQSTPSNSQCIFVREVM
jgi:hypothetical protein